MSSLPPSVQRIVDKSKEFIDYTFKIGDFLHLGSVSSPVKITLVVNLGMLKLPYKNLA